MTPASEWVSAHIRRDVRRVRVVESAYAFAFVVIVLAIGALLAVGIGRAIAEGWAR